MEYGGARSMSTYLRNKEKRTPQSYQKKYNVEIEESAKNNFLNTSRRIFTNCNFYIDDLISLSTIQCPSSTNTPTKEWEHPQVKREHLSEEENEKCSCTTELIQSKDYVDDPLFVNDNNAEQCLLTSTPLKSEWHYTNNSTICTLPSVSKIDDNAKQQNSSLRSTVPIDNSYINKKENLEILIVQNGGRIHNILTGEVTHIVSNNMALGNKKYAELKKKVKKSKVFIIEDTYVFDCVQANSRLCEQLYLPKTLRYNSRQITEYFPFNKKRKRNQPFSSRNNESLNKEIFEKKDVQHLNESQAKDHGENDLHDYPSERNGYDYLEKGKKETCERNEQKEFNEMLEQNLKNAEKYQSESKGTKENKISEKMEALLMEMNYEDLKKYIINDCNAYFARLYKYYCDKERKETVFCTTSDLYLNKHNFEDFARKYKILNYLTTEEIAWIKTKSKLNLRIRNIWENDFIHFFFNMVLKKRFDVEKKNSTITNDAIEEEEISDKLIDSISGYFHNSRLYILGNWTYITKAIFDFNDIQLKPQKKCVYLYIDFDYYFLNASIKKKKNNNLNKSETDFFNDKNINNSIFCVCHSTKKEDSFGMISSINYWAAKNKIYKGMLKMDATRILHKNINFIRYDFSNILKCSFLLLLVLMNFSKHVKVSSVDESILQLFYTTEEEIIAIAKKISNDIYNLTNLNVTIGISDSLEVARHALKFCKKRFLFFDFYHHFCMFVRQYIDWKKDKLSLKIMKQEEKQKREEAKKKNPGEIMEEEKEEKQGEEMDKQWKQTREMTAEKDNGVVDIESLIDIEKLFDIYMKFEEKKRKKDIEDDEMIDAQNNRIDASFLQHVKHKDPLVEDVFERFMNVRKNAIEHITNTFFDKIIHPVSKHFFFYLKNDFYFDILKKFNYLKGEFVDFNIYYLREADYYLNWDMENEKKKIYESEGVCDDENGNGDKVFVSGENKKIMHKNRIISENLNETKCMSIRANYGIRFHKINDFYYLIYFMTKQLHLRLKIKNSKAKNLSMNFFLREENENIDPAKYLGRGKVFNLRSNIKLAHHIDSFFVYFFKIIFKFQFIMHKLKDLRGVQLTCYDIIKDTFCSDKKSILHYFTDTSTGKSINNLFKNNNNNKKSCFTNASQIKTTDDIDGSRDNINEESIHWKKRTKEINKKKGNSSSNVCVGESKKKSKRRKTTVKENEKTHEKKITDYIVGFNSQRQSSTNGSICARRKKKGSDICNKGKHILSYFVENINEINKKKKLIDKILVEEITKKKKHNTRLNCFSPSIKNRTFTRSRPMRNYKILDFYPNIILKRRAASADMNGNSYNGKIETVEQINIFDSIINMQVKVKDEVDMLLQVEGKKEKRKEKEATSIAETEKITKEKKTCCYMFFLKVYNDMKEKPNSHSDNINLFVDCANKPVCYICICNRLYDINQQNGQNFHFYLYVKKMFSYFVAYFVNTLKYHKCDDTNNDTDNTHANNSGIEKYLYKILFYILNDLCEILHKKRNIDVLHKLLVNFKRFVELQKKNFFPYLLQSILNKYIGNQEE